MEAGLNVETIQDPVIVVANLTSKSSLFYSNNNYKGKYQVELLCSYNKCALGL